MKFLSLTLICLMSAKALACSQFNGTWNCGGKRLDIRVEQQDQKQVLTGSSVPLVIDGQMHSANQGDVSIKYRVSCDEKSNVLEVFTSVNDMMDVTQKFTLVSAKSMNVEVTMGSSDQTMPPEKIHMACSRK